ncbi:SdpI family protein [Devosia soli]|nr:SdpI family protein [Devosia soli]
MSSLVTRFHLLIFAVTLSITAVCLFRIPEDFAFPAHWHGSGADWLWPRDPALTIAPIVQLTLMGAFHGLDWLLTPNHLAKVRHILDPALSLLLVVPAACQLALLFIGIGSDLDLFRGVAIGLAATLALLGLVLFTAERHSYAGLRMPWPIPSDRAWTLVHRLSGIASILAAIVLAALAWFDVGPGILVMSFALTLAVLPIVAGAVTLIARQV